ncbi:MAG: pknB [Solirubrobacterales bacterium]|jgi:serine/threonine-protein kinase|nr:pknB [Solirubrobacterales bacterium]
MAAASKGTVVDERYKLDHKIGSGGMADVWLAEDSELGRNVAIKILHDRFAQDREFVERFRREAQSAAGLQHPNVVSIFDRGEFRDTYFIAMEYVDGPQLKQLVTGGMGTRDAVDFTRQILNAARFAHRKGIVHRDLKPQNVLIDEDGRARVADFGIARGESSDITATGSVMGTAQYLSPEQAQGKETTPASDIYSIGVILYEALTGRVPFQGDSAIAVALKQVSEPPRAPSAINPEVPPALDAVVMRALAKDPEARFRDADAFMRALDAAESAPLRPRPEDTAAFAAVPSAGEADQLEDDEYDEEAWREEEERRRRRRWIFLAILVALVAGLVAYALTRPGSIEVPSVVGIPQDTATERLEAEGLDVDLNPVPNQAARETVLEQDPVGGESVDEGSTVILTVSSGPAIVPVPDVSGLNERQATKVLQEAGLEVDPGFAFSDTVPKGRAIGTEPGPGTSISSGSTVILTISRGSNKVEVPDVVGLDDQQALTILSDAELGGNVLQRDDDAPQGLVVGQSPGPGRLVKRGAPVTIFVSSGAIAVPNVIGLTRKQAVTSLKREGFTPSIVEEPTEDPAEDNRVLSQNPPAGTRGQRGDPVTLTVAALI